jgi:Family of unknown function (DUF5684)
MNTQENQNSLQPYRKNRRERRKERGGRSVVGGLLLIGLGVLLFLQTQGNLSIGKWWALLILIPAIAALVNVWNEFHKAGNLFNRRAGTSLFGGILLTAITAAILMNLDWGYVGPGLLILLGVAFFL